MVANLKDLGEEPMISNVLFESSAKNLESLVRKTHFLDSNQLIVHINY